MMAHYTVSHRLNAKAKLDGRRGFKRRHAQPWQFRFRQYYGFGLGHPGHVVRRGKVAHENKRHIRNTGICDNAEPAHLYLPRQSRWRGGAKATIKDLQYCLIIGNQPPALFDHAERQIGLSRSRRTTQKRCEPLIAFRKRNGRTVHTNHRCLGSAGGDIN
jgi:hypothetical protein